ncbi:MAG: hypothetical protein DRP47_03645 [Candidatus Zixiibacteriota bacterium]|nr:MAG: hypothetical protein DRP47_03645 [candidate division Zixibacteria bacterium]
MAVSSLLSRYRGLINYTILNYLDKFLTFSVPLLVLYLLRDRALYNEIEYIYSIAAIVSIVIELGVRNYFLYAYKEETEREVLVEKVRSCFLLQFVIYISLSIVLLGLTYLIGQDFRIVFLCITIRALFMYFISFFTIYYRLIDRPSFVFAFSISVNMLTILVVLAFKGISIELPLIYFFLGQIMLVGATLLFYVQHKNKVSFSVLSAYVKEALIFAWPIILNVFLFMFVSNYGKVYARNYLSEDRMFHISFIQRIALVIQLAHTSAVGYLSKRIFVEKGNSISYKILGLYSVMMALSVIGILGLLFGMRILDLKQAVPIDLITVLIIVYTLAWCYGAYFEMYINKMNKNRYILFFSGVSALIFISIVNLVSLEPLLRISLGMAASMICSLFMIVTFIMRKSRG